MSKLKAILATPHPKMKNACDGAIEVYLKSEADKVIADLEESHKMEVEQLLIEIAEQKRLRDMALASVPNVLRVMKIIQHQKYKRCLAMARWCNAELETLDYKAATEYTYKDVWRIATSYFTKWRKRWLELAEKFKPNNSTAQ